MKRRVKKRVAHVLTCSLSSPLLLLLLLPLQPLTADGSFGLIKLHLRSHQALTCEEMYDVLHGATKSLNKVTRADQVTWRDWKVFLEGYFNKVIPHVSDKHYFVFYPEGNVKTKEWFDSPEAERFSLHRPDLTDKIKKESEGEVKDVPVQPNKSLSKERMKAFDTIRDGYVNVGRFSWKDFLGESVKVNEEWM